MLGYGKIWVFTPSTGAILPEAKLLGVVNPHEIKQTIMGRIEAARGSQLSVGDESPAAHHDGEVVSLLKEIRDCLQKIEGLLPKG